VSPWLRHLLEALYQDMSALYEWHSETDAHKKKDLERVLGGRAAGARARFRAIQQLT
jgi:hypothetical protein